MSVERFCFTTLCDWFKNLRNLLDQSGCKPKTNRDLVTCVFPRLAPVRVFALSSHWFIVLFMFLVTGHCNCFGFGFKNIRFIKEPALWFGPVGGGGGGGTPLYKLYSYVPPQRVWFSEPFDLKTGIDLYVLYVLPACLK